MSTIKSSAENLTLNADGANNDIKFQSNGSEVASIDQAGTITATTFTGAGSTPSITDNGNANAITIDSAENVGIGITPKTWYSTHTALQIAPTGALYNSSNWQDFNIACNAYYDSGGTESYIQTDAACKIRLTDSGLMDFKVAASGSADAAITWTTPLTIALAGDVTVGTGDIVFGTASKGIVLGATTNVAANTLSDYEEGNHASAWSSSSGSITVGRNDLAYTKIGNMVHMTGEVSISSVSSPAGSKMSLPFATAGHTVDRNMNWGGQGMVCYSVAQLQDNTPTLYANAGESVVNLLYQQDDGAFANFNAAAGDTFMFSFSYKTDS